MEPVSQHTHLQVNTTYRQIVRMALPISFSILIPQINFVTNNIFLGHYDSEALAVAGITGVYYLIFGAIGFGLNNGMQTLIARRAGENRPEEIGKIFNQGVLISLGIAATGILLTWLVAPTLFRYFITDESRLESAITFSRIRIWGLPFLYIYQMRNALLVGINQTRYLAPGAIAEMTSNILFDALLIYGVWIFPEMGLNGAAIASIIAEFTGMFVIFLVIHWKGIGRQFQLFRDFRPSRHTMMLIAGVSAPLVFQHGISVMSWEYFFLLNDAHGEMALTISNAMRNLFGLAGVIIWAFAATANSMASNVIGQGKPQMVWPLLMKLVKISAGSMLVLVVLMNLLPHTILSIYGQDQEFILRGTPVLRIVSTALLIASVSVIFLFAVTGSGNPGVTLLIEIFAISSYTVYVYLVLDKYFLPITIGWMSEWLYWLCMFVPAFWYMRSGKWKGKVI